ncbi:transmembrane 9 superfamily member 2-like isoform X1 [Drosophila tropicalis]|uniref:transmembrane 9 superfamily member 2-like isoform X1 n=1 Tax=Drosophila tropicalis TaxID=46794 RepID=UPI0035AC12CF
MYSFSVNFVRNDSLKWSNRWDIINNNYDQSMWFSIFESLILAFICSLWTWKLLRRLSKKEVLEKPPWSLLQCEVFRSPSNAVLLSSLIGCGVQILVTLLVTLIFAAVVFQTPDYQGHVLYFAIHVFGLLALLAGNISGRFYRRFEGQKWTKTAAITADFPGLLISLVIAMGEIFYINKSSGSLTFNSISFLLTLWLFVAFPLTYLGTFFGFYKLKTESDVVVSETPRVIPNKPILTRLIPGIVFGGLLPFLTLYINLPIIQYALSSLNYGILLLILLLEIVICAEASILLCYDHLRVEDYNWWWRSFLTSGFVSFYLFIFCCYEHPSYVDMASVILYFGFTIIMVMLLFLLTGSVGFLACLWFINRLFGNVDKKVGFYNANLSVAVESPEKTKENFLVADI